MAAYDGHSHDVTFGFFPLLQNSAGNILVYKSYFLVVLIMENSFMDIKWLGHKVYVVLLIRSSNCLLKKAVKIYNSTNNT